MMRLLILFISAFMCSTLLLAQVEKADTVQMEEADSAFLAEVDSVIVAYERWEQMRKIEETIGAYNDVRLRKEMSFKTDGALHLARGLLLSWTDHGFVKQEARFEPKGDRVNWTDYVVGGMPLLVNWGLKAAGVESRSKLERMLTANAMALGLSFGTTELLKHTIREGRPDLSDLHAFPSGHTCFAFVSATVLSREYGHLSPWVTVGSYAAATGTEFLRVGHNKHWMNDLYMGAGIGVMTTNLAYFLTDKIFGADAINKPELRRKDVLRLMKFNERPSGFSFVTGTEVGDRTIRMDDVRIKTGAAISAGADVVWFITPKVAVELLTRVVDAQAKVYDSPTVFTGGHLNLYHFDLGGKLSLPHMLGQRVAVRAFAGARLMDGDSFTDGRRTLVVDDAANFEFGLGLTYECIDTSNYAWGFTCDYYHTFSRYMKNRYSVSSSWKILF